MRRSILALTVSLVALSLAGHAAAQDATPLALGQEIQGQLTADDPRIDTDQDGRFVYDLYSMTAAAGQRLEIVMRSDDFDAFLQVFSAGDLKTPLAEDDDGLGEGTSARLRFTAPRPGAYLIRARTLSGLAGGDYALLAADRGAAPPLVPPIPIAVGATVTGDISDGDPVETGGDAGEYVHDAYVFTVEQDERVAIALESEAFDAFLRVGRLDAAGEFEELASNDDSGAGGLDSYLVFTAPSSGDYVIRTSPLDGTTEGGYSLSLTEGPAPLVPQSIAIGDSIEGTLSADDGGGALGQRTDAYSFTAAEGQRIVATMRSDDFDTYLELFAENGESEGGRYSVGSDDDGAGEGTNSRLAYTVETPGRYTLEARAFSGDAQGAYTLTFEEARPDPEPAPIAFGATLQGEIAEDDPRDDENRGFDAYRFTGIAGNRVQVIMRSGDFDSYLQIGAAESEFSALASDDDGLGEGTDSRLNYILPDSGDFIVRASPLYADAEGLYSLELIDRGPQPTPGSILVGGTARGSLSEEDAISDDGGYYDAYRISVKEGDKLRLTMVSNEFDAFIDIGREDNEGNFTSVVSDDDGLSDTHAKIDWAVEDDGDYVIRARSFAQGQSGAYALTIEPKE